MPFSLLPPPRRARGFTLIELMVSMTIGLVILLGMATLFATNTKSQAELEKSNRQTESGRYAIQLMSDDIKNAGYYAEFDPTPMPTPGAMPAICSTTLATLRSGLPVPVQGLDDSATAATCLQDVKTDTDVLVIRRVETCLLGTGNCDAATAGGAFFQASLCQNASELGSGDTALHYSLQSAVADLDKHKRNCSDVAVGTAADVRRFVTHVYYVANNHNPNDGIPTLMRARLSGVGTLAYTYEPMAEGIESLQVEYGVDTDSNGTPDSYTTAPATPAAWRGVVAVKLHLLSRNTEESKSYTDSKTYTLGLTAAGQPKVVSIGTSLRKYKRHAFSTTIGVLNTAGRRTP